MTPAEITEIFGERCEEFHPECACCRVWQQQDEIERLRQRLAAVQEESDRRTREIEACYVVQRDLKARLAEAERDAARYRWLRKKTAIVSKRRMSGDCYPAFEILDFPSPTHIAPRPDIELDASIDAAMRFADSASSNRPCTLTAPDRETPVT